MTLFRRILLCALISAPLLPAADQLTGFPFQNETLRYRVVWPGGKSLGEVTTTAHQTADGWDFEMAANVAIPIVPIADKYKASAATSDLCSSTLTREISHGKTKVTEKTEFDQKANMALRKTLVPAGGGQTEMQLPTCARDALTYQFFARREMGQGRVPPSGKIFFGSAYEVKTNYTGAMDIPFAGKPKTTDRLEVSVKGPASDFSFEIYYDRDAARTPLLIKIPLPALTVLAGTGALKMRVAYFSPLPPARSGIADYSEALIASLEPLVDLEVFSSAEQPTIPRASISRSTMPATTAITPSSTRPRCAIPASW